MTEKLTDINGVGPETAKELRDAGFETPADVFEATIEELASVRHLGEKSAKAILTDDDSSHRGRTSKLTKQRQESIALMLEDGHSIAATCRCNDITQRTFYDWLEKGSDQDEGIYSQFSQRVARARGHGERRLTDDLLRIAREERDTKALLSILKSRYPESWSDDDAGQSAERVEVYLTGDKD